MQACIEKHNFDIVLAIFWHNEDGQWEGVFKDNLHNTDAKIFMSEKVILMIKKDN